MKKILIFILIISPAIVVGLGIWNSNHNVNSSSKHEAKETYQCPMHPEVIQDHPGNCPICGMRLVKIEKAVASSGEKEVLFYRHPMNPEITSQVPAKDEMGMDYITVYKEPAETLPDSDVKGHASIHLTPEKMRAIGVLTEPAIDEELILPLSFTGTVFYNAEILQTLMQYRDAIQVKQRYKKPTFEKLSEARAETWNLRLKLRRLGISEEFLKKNEQALADPTSFVPANIIFGASGAYVDARLPVSDLGHLRIGQKARLFSSLDPETQLEGEVRSLDSVVDPATQTLAVRLEVVSGHEYLRPGMFIEIEMDIHLGKKLSIPSHAVFNPGKQAYVFIEKEPGIFVPQKVKLGTSAGDRVQILEGVTAGDKIVISANFLLDSESRFQAARSTVAPAGGHNHD